MMNRATSLLLVGLALTAPTLAQSDAEKEAIAAFKKGFKPDPKPLDEALKGTENLPNNPQFRDAFEAARDRQKVIINKWRKAIDGLQRYGSKNVAKLIVPAWKKIDKLVKPLKGKHAKWKKRVDKAYEKVLKLTNGEGIAGKKKLEPKVNAAAQTWLIDSRRASEFRRTITDLETLHDNLRTVVSMMNEPEGLTLLLEKSFGDKKTPLPIKVAAIKAAANLGASMLPALTHALESGKKPDELAAAIYGIGLIGAKAKASAPRLIELLAHEDGGVREYAALALQQMNEPASIKPLIDLLDREGGYAKRRIANVLEILTAQQHGMNASAWKAWFAKEGADYAAGKKELGKGKPSAHAKFDKENYYYGIPQDGASIVYIIDCSGSMIVDKDKPDWDEPQDQRGPRAAAKGKSRSDASKKELIRALKTLGSEKRFNIIWYNHTARLYKKKMVSATPENVKAAIAFIEKLPADSSTNIFEAMKMAFTLTGRGSFDSAYDVEFDTIFLMTDGKPTLQGVGDDDPKRIIEGVRKWNSLQRVVIHTIGMGDKGIDDKFMHQLAKENRGEYRKMIGDKVVDGTPGKKGKN